HVVAGVRGRRVARGNRLGVGPESGEPQDDAVSRSAPAGGTAARRLGEGAMTPVGCEVEAEVLAAALHGDWDPECGTGVASCASCGDGAVIGEASGASRGAGSAIPDSGRVWWLAQHRARLEAAEAANRPMLAVQVIALVCLCALLSTYLP